MKICEQAPTLDEILDGWRVPLGNDFAAYRNHCYRVLNFCLAFSGESAEVIRKISIAVAFHDLGIWANNTFDYLEPSILLAREYLAKTKQDKWNEEIASMIQQHHKLRKYKANPEWLVESFRKADWIDVSKGVLKFGLNSDLVSETLSAFPNAGFHKRLAGLTLQRLRTNPFSPLPMMKL